MSSDKDNITVESGVIKLEGKYVVAVAIQSAEKRSVVSIGPVFETGEEAVLFGAATVNGRLIRMMKFVSEYDVNHEGIERALNSVNERLKRDLAAMLLDATVGKGVVH